MNYLQIVGGGVDNHWREEHIENVNASGAGEPEVRRALTSERDADSTCCLSVKEIKAALPTDQEEQATKPVPEPSFKVVAHTQQEEDAYDFVKYRTNVKFTGVIGSIAHIVKGALGAGILCGHVAYAKAGVGTAVPLNVIFGAYMGYCLHLLVKSAQILYKRTRIPLMSYADVGEAAVICFPNPKIQKYAKAVRYMVDTMICLDLFGSCVCYQIIISKSLKQLVEDSLDTAMAGQFGYPNLRVYMACMIPLIILLCLITRLKYLAPFSLAANMIILLCIALAVNYAMVNNPSLDNLVAFTTFLQQFHFAGMIVFSMSCAGVVIAIENNMREPHKFPLALGIGMSLIVFCTFMVSFFGYAAYLNKSESPITVNFPMTIGPKILKGSIVLMIYVTHALNFFVPFNLCFHYLKKLHKPEQVYKWELIYRACFVVTIGVIGIIFPTIDALIGFIGSFCLSNMAFIWPSVINLLVIWERPGLGKYRWRLIRNMFLLVVGIVLLICGSVVNGVELITVFYQNDPTKSQP